MYTCPCCHADSLTWSRRTAIVLTERMRCPACGAEITERVWQRRILMLVAMPLVGFGSFTAIAMLASFVTHMSEAFLIGGAASFIGGTMLVLVGPNCISPLLPAPPLGSFSAFRLPVAITVLIASALNGLIGAAFALMLGVLA